MNRVHICTLYKERYYKDKSAAFALREKAAKKAVVNAAKRK